jgi:hypothetical protein
MAAREAATVGSASRRPARVGALAPRARLQAILVASRRHEGAVCAVALTLLSLAISLAHIRHGGFYYDDWPALALTRFPPHGGLLHGLWLYYGQRPGEVLYYAALESLFGYNASAQLALAALMLAALGTCLFALLRRLGLAALEAGSICALVIVFPFSDSIRLWPIMSMATLAIALSLLGVLVALRAFEAQHSRAAALHACSLALYLLAVLSYEVCAAAACAAGAVYAVRFGARRARWRWALDMVAIGATLAFMKLILPVDIATPSRLQSLSGAVHHTGTILAQGGQLLGSAAAAPFGAGRAVADLALALLSLTALAAAALRKRLPAGDPARATLGRWLAIASGGAGLALAAWAVYIPAPSHYSPGASGTANRVNALAGVGLVLCLYACAALVGVLLGKLAERRTPVAPQRAAALAASLAAVALGAAWLEHGAADSRLWDRAGGDERALLASVQTALPDPPAGATIYTFDQRRAEGPVPVLDTALDLTSALRLAYDDPTLAGAPLRGAASLTCAPRGLRSSLQASSPLYGAVYLVDVGARRVLRVTSPASCAQGASTILSASRRS